MKNKNLLLIGSLFILHNFVNTASSPNLVKVHHSIHRDGSIQSVKQHGLLNWRALFEKGMTENEYTYWGFSDQADVIYFNPNPNAEQNADIAYEVDSNTTYVYNSGCRASVNHGYYQRSKILLKDYLKNYYAAQELKKTTKQGLVLLHHITSEPIIYSPEELSRMKNAQIKDKDVALQYYGYRPEVIIAMACIPPEKLLFLKE